MDDMKMWSFGGWTVAEREAARRGVTTMIPEEEAEEAAIRALRERIRVLQEQEHDS